MGRRGPRPWIACPGSRQPATEHTRYRGVPFGRCAICRRWLALTKRTERLAAHAGVPPRRKP